MESYFKKVIKDNKYFAEFFLISDDHKIMIYAKRNNEKFYDHYFEEKGFVNKGWTVFYGEYDHTTDNIVVGTTKVLFHIDSCADIFGRLLYTRNYLRGTLEYMMDFKQGYDYDNALSTGNINEKKISGPNGLQNALYIANPNNIQGFGFTNIQKLSESDIKNPTYYIIYGSAYFGEQMRFIPYYIACFYDVENGRKLVIEGLPEYSSSRLFRKFFSDTIFEEFAAHDGICIFYEPKNKMERKECSKYMFKSVNGTEYSVTEDEMYADVKRSSTDYIEK